MSRQLALLITVLCCAATAGAAIINVPADQPTIAAALGAAAPGDEIVVADGTYVQTGTLNLTQAVTITGASEAGCIIDATGVGGYGFDVQASDVTLQDFTLLPTAVNYPIHASGTSNPPDGYDNLTIQRVTVTGAHQRTAFDVHGYNGVVLSHLTAADATGGNGFQVTGCVDVDADNLTSSDNAWGSFAIYCSGPSYLNRASDDVLIDGDSCSFGEKHVFHQDEFGLTITNVTVTGYEWMVRNEVFRPDAAGFWFYQDTAADAIALALALDGTASGSYVWNIASGDMLVGTGMVIQHAIDHADPGDLIDVQAGTFEEQLNVGLDLTIAGAGAGVTTILSPTTLTDSFSTGSNDNYPVVYVHDADLALSGVTVDGDGRGNANYRFVGVGFWNAGGSIADAEVLGVRDTPFSGAQHGVAVYAYNDTGGPYAIAMDDVLVTDFQKNALALLGTGLTVDLDGVTATGAGPTDVTAQNGIQIGLGAGGAVDGCDIADVAYTGDTWTASGLLLDSGGGAVTATNVTMDGCQTSFYVFDMSATLVDCDVTNPAGGDAGYAYSSGAVAGNGPKVAAAPFGGAWTGPNGRDAVAFAIDGGTYVGAGVTDSWGPSAYAQGPVDFSVANATVSNWDWGVVCYEDGGTVTGASSGNDLVGNTSYGVFSNTAVDYDATGNWWGDASGPYHPVANPLGLGDPVSDMVLFDPWVGMADVGPTPASSGPINCSASAVLAFHYAPADSTPPLRGYEIVFQAGPEVSFGLADIVDSGVLAGIGTNFFQKLDNGDGTFTVTDAILGPTDGLEAAADLFTVEFHGAGDGTALVEILSYKFRELMNLDIFATVGDAEILVDCTAPGAISGLNAEPANESVVLTWTDPAPVDFTGLEVWRGVWHDGANASAYPEYDDLPGSTIPTRPADRAAAMASPEWMLAGTALPGAGGFTDAHAPRGVYYYEVFAVDAALNYGPPAAGTDRATNYWLGDVSDGVCGQYDGEVTFADISCLGAAFGESDGDPDYDPEIDVGPTYTMSPYGVPTTDDVIDFEDVIVFAINYDTVVPLPASGAETAVLAWRRTAADAWTLSLVEACSALKGLRLRLPLPAGVTASVAAGDLLLEQGAPHFLADAGDGAIDASLALLGAGLVVQGTGDLLVVTLDGEAELGLPDLVLRDAANGDTPFELTATSAPDLPASYRLLGSHPNPFNPKTTIRFELPEAQQVRLAVFSLDGRLVTTLVDGALAAGSHDAVWDGRDARGGAVASGVYFARIDAGPLHENLKLMLLK